MAQLSLFKSRRQRGTKAPPPKELNTHIMVADTLRRWISVDWRWTHFPAGEWRHPATGARLKRMGLNPSWPDFLLLAPRPGGLYFLELKRKGKDLKGDQLMFAWWCHVHGYSYACHDNYADAIETLKGWGALRVRIAA
jgi:hypothetical protein